MGKTYGLHVTIHSNWYQQLKNPVHMLKLALVNLSQNNNSNIQKLRKLDKNNEESWPSVSKLFSILPSISFSTHTVYIVLMSF